MRHAISTKTQQSFNKHWIRKLDNILHLPPVSVLVPDDEEESTLPTNQWAAGARPLALRAPPGQGRVIETNLGVAFSDPGANLCVVNSLVADTFPGGRVEQLPAPEKVYGPADANGNRTLLFEYNRVLHAEVTIHYSVDDQTRGSSCGLLPTIKEIGMPLALKVCNDPKFFSSLVPDLPQLAVVLGDEVELLPAWQSFYNDYLNACRPNGAPAWTHSQRVSRQGCTMGTTIETQQFHPAAVPLDTEDGRPLPYPPRSPFRQDTSLEMSADPNGLDADVLPSGTPQGKLHPADDRGDSKIPRTQEAMEAYLKDQLQRKGRVLDRYLPHVAALFLKHREVLLDARPSQKVEPLDCKVNPGATPSRAGLHRRPMPVAIPALNSEVQSLMHHGMAVHIPWKEGEPLPPNLYINGLVITIRRPPIGAPKDAPTRIRMCIDPAANKHSAQAHIKTVIPNLDQHLNALEGSSLLSAFDMPNAYSQNRLTEGASDLFGFAIPDLDGKLQLYKMTGAPFGWHLFPALFQARMEQVLAGTLTCRNSTSRAYIDDAYVATRGAKGTRLQEVWGEHAPTPEETAIVNDHLHCIDAALQGYRDFGYVIKLAKCELLQEEISVCGILCDGVSRRVDPARVDGFANLGKPTRVTLTYLQQICGTLNYMAPYLGSEYITRSEPLFELTRVASRTLAAAGQDKAKRRAAMASPHAQWGQLHDDALKWCTEAMYHSQVRYFLRWDRPVHVISDASDTGVAACLAQYDDQGTLRICYTLSRRFTTQQKRWSVGAREVYGLLLACRQWSKILHFCPELVLESDHHNIITSLQDLENTALARWVLELSTWDAFNRARVHRRGAVNILMDTLSRQAASFTLHQRDEPLAQQFSPILRAHYPEEEAPPSNVIRIMTRRTATDPKDATPLAGGGGGGGGAPPAPRPARAGIAQRQAAAVAAEALRAPPPAPALEVFSNPHEHSLTPFMLNILLAQERIPPDVIARYRSDKTMAIQSRAWDNRVVILAKGRILVPEEKDLMHGIFQVIHDQHLHCGLGAAQERLVKAKLYIPNFTKHFEEYYKACTCQHARAPHGEQDTGPLLVTPRFYPLSHLYIDFCSLPFTDEVDNKSYVGAAIIVDAASRACEFTAVENKTALTAVACLQRWINHWGRPVMVHCDNGSHFTGGEFTDFLARLNIAQDPGTPYHSAARGLVERLVGKLKDGLRRLLPQGKLLQWPAVLNELELLLNQAPHRALGGISPYDYLLRGHRYRDERFVVTRDADHPLGRVTLNWAYSLPGSPSPQREEDLAFCLDSMRQIADWCAEISSFKASIESQGSKHPLNAQLGDTVLRFMALRENSLEPIYQGPYKITQDLGGDFYTVCELLAGDALGKPVQVHSSRIIKYDMSRSSADAEHQRKLPPDHYVVEAVLHGPDKDHEGHFLIKWLGVPEPKWERAHGLRQVLKFRQFCHDNNLTLEGKIPRRVKFAPELQPQPVQPPAQLRVMQHGLFYTFCPNALTQSSTF